MIKGSMSSFFSLALNLVLKPGQPICSLQFSVQVDSVGGGASHHGLAPAYLCGILGVLHFDWGWGWALGSLSCGRSSCAHHLQCFGGPRDVLGPLSEGDAISRIIPVTRTSPSLES
jgi:hypothetical protein